LQFLPEKTETISVCQMVAILDFEVLLRKTAWLISLASDQFVASIIYGFLCLVLIYQNRMETSVQRTTSPASTVFGRATLTFSTPRL
jgi:hypothetical protein